MTHCRAARFLLSPHGADFRTGSCFLLAAFESDSNAAFTLACLLLRRHDDSLTIWRSWLRRGNEGAYVFFVKKGFVLLVLQPNLVQSGDIPGSGSDGTISARRYIFLL